MVKAFVCGNDTYRLVAERRGAGWAGRALRGDAGDPFGVESSGATAEEALDRLTRWLMWQREHTEALEELQNAERSYHRTIAGSAFASPTDGPSPLELQKESLEALEVARHRLDRVRGLRPETS